MTDRWHLLKNLSEAVQKVLVRQYNKINAILAEKQSQDKPNKPICDQDIPGKSNIYESTVGRIRLQRFKQLKELQGRGYSMREMARHLGMSRQTIKGYLYMETLPGDHKAVSIHWKDFFPISKSAWRKNPLYS